MRVHHPKLRNIVHNLHVNVFTASKRSTLYILFAITAADVVSCGGPKMSPRTSSKVHHRSFEISRDIQRVKTFKFRNIPLSNVLIV